MVATEDKQKSLDLALSQINQTFGKGSIMKLGDATDTNIERISSGILPLDVALGGGYPVGRIIESYGMESCGKSSIALHAIAEVQRNGGTAAIIDAEHALDPAYAKNLGVDVDQLLVSQPSSGEEGLEIADSLVKSGAVKLIVVDSVAALTPRAELEGEMGSAHMGLQARLMSQALRKITGAAHSTKTTLLFINQLRSKIGVTYGSSNITTGGNALKFYASVRMDIRKIQTLKKGTEEYGIRTKISIAKNKTFPPYHTAEFDILFGKGVSIMGCIVDAAEENKIIEKKGSWYNYQGDAIGQGKEKAIEFLEEHQDIAEEIKTKVMEVINGPL